MIDKQYLISEEQLEGLSKKPKHPTFHHMTDAREDGFNAALDEIKQFEVDPKDLKMASTVEYLLAKRKKEIELLGEQ